MDLTTVNPQATFKFLNFGSNNYISYLLRVTPPALVYKAAKEFDAMMEQARTDVLTLVECMNHPQTDSDEELDRTTKLVCLPIRDGGMGHCTAVDRSPPAFITAVLTTRSHHSLSSPEKQLSLRPYCNDTYISLCGSLRVDHINQCPTVLKTIPADAISLTSPLHVLLDDLRSLITKDCRMFRYGGQ